MAGEVGGVGAVNSYVPVSNEVDLATLMFTVQSERATLLDGMVRNQASKIQYNNERLKELNEAMSKVNNLGQSGGNLGNVSMQALNTSKNPPVIETMTVQQFLDMKGVETPNKDKDNNYSKEEIALITTNIKNSVDSLTSTSQLDMTQLQSTMSKYNQTFEALSNFISKYFQSLQTITGNLR
ncbi:MAG TPA: virulence-associated V antigen [Candidatus Competibacteraceae bacterium]|nr:MAG: hypothetical protein EKK71_05590 [Candidatus Competibacteraceae bacterium]HOB61164.1 virulence-associated V antigen [Candidatus Competibacteraceae bacterium]HQA24759.1 virulence-associated V antigen [Candidatus Competibacteraceae bacterium]HQD55487.1 virulence-associated V antigen [Candidatus Competibacteraceae bacterium]